MRTQQAFACACAMAIALLVAAPARGGELQDLLDQYTLVQSASLDASVQVEPGGGLTECCAVIVVPEGNPPIQGTFSYSADGGRWRLDSFLDPTRYPGMNTTVIYNGAQFAYFARDADVLSIQHSEPPDVLGMTLPNPFLEPLQFLFPIDDSNELSRVRLLDAWEKATATDLSNVTWESVTFEGRTLDVAAFPGAIYNGVAYEHHVYALPEAHDRPVMIDRVDDQMQVLTRTRFSHYEQVPAPDGSPLGWWPRRVTWEAFDDQGQLAGKIGMIIDQLAINDPAAIPTGEFQPDSLTPEAGTVVIDGTIQQ